jgi:hypothetical protein
VRSFERGVKFKLGPEYAKPSLFNYLPKARSFERRLHNSTRPHEEFREKISGHFGAWVRSFERRRKIL